MFRIFDTFYLAFERLAQHRLLVFWTLLGLAAATTLTLSLTLYVDAVNTRLLSSRLSDPPYAFRFRYLGSWEGNIGFEDVAAASATIEQRFVETIGLPAIQQARYISSGIWSLRTEDQANVGSYKVGTLEGADSQIQITSGAWGEAETVHATDTIPVLLSEAMLYKTGLQVGDKLIATRPGSTTPVTFEIVALWIPVNASDPSWMLPPKFFDEVFLVQADDLNALMAGVENPVEEVDWSLIFDGSSLRTSDVGALSNRIVDGQRLVNTALPGIRLDLSPLDGLKAFTQEVNQLTQQLVIVILPVAGLILYFVTMLAGMLVGRQQQEDVTLSSRGMSRRAIIMLHALMWLILALAALLIGMIASPFVVQLVGQTTSFLQFNDHSTRLDIKFTQQTLTAGTLTALLAASSGLYLAWRSSAQNITSFKRSQARATKAWWQRFYLDILLLIPAGYTYYTLNSQGGLVTTAENPFGDPIVFVAPTLFSLGMTLLFLRLYPFVLNLGARVMSYGSSISLLMALRELTRSIGRYRGALLMMGFTLSLTGFTASMASTLDRSLQDSVNYKIGADGVLVIAADAQTETGTDDSGQATVEITGYNTLPATNLLTIDGVYAASRVGRYPGQIVLPNQRLTGTVLGVDRASMAAVTRFRDDYANQQAADLFNQLAGNRNGVILSSQTAQAYSLQIGQEITLQISALGVWYETKVPIIALVDYFPTLDPSEGFFLITPLDPIFELVGTELPHDIWLSFESGADKTAVHQAVIEMGFPVLRWLDPEQSLQAARTAPARRGVLGFLSIGFISSILLTLVSSVIQSTASFRAQALQLGSLRAMGLGSASVAAYLILSQGIAAMSGILAGTAIGMGTTLLFLPLLDFSGGLPPYLVRVAWDDITLVYALFAGVLLLVTLFTTIFLGRERLSTLLKLGDA